jgi:branched-chain amino acid aminotransferase
MNGTWHDTPPMIASPMTHAMWLGSCVFDGARAFEGTAPDLGRHCERVVNSAKTFGLKPMHDAAAIEAMAREGIAKFGHDAALYIRPMYWADDGFVDVDPDTTQFALSIYDAAMPAPSGSSVTCSPFRRPSLEYAPTDAKAACHYPNSARAMREARARGFDNAAMLDPLSNVSELATANIWFARDGEVFTPVPNGTFLNGITRQRIITLLREDGIKVHEGSLKWKDFCEADEVFSTGNWAKVAPITRIETRDLQPGPVYARARELYWNYAHSTGKL